MRMCDNAAKDDTANSKSYHLFLIQLFAGTVVMSLVLWTAINTMFRPLAQDALLPCIIAGKETSWLALDTKCGRLQVRYFQLAAATVASASRT